MINLETLAIKIDSRLRLMVTGLLQQIGKHTSTMDDPPELLGLHIKADEIDSKYYNKIRAAIKKARLEGSEEKSYSIYKKHRVLYLKNIKHPGYSTIHAPNP